MAEKFILNPKRIDSIDSLDLWTLSFADINPHYGTGRSIFVKDDGYQKHYRYRTGIATNVGDIEKAVWCEVVRRMINRDYEDALHSQLLEWEKKHDTCRYSEKEMEEHALWLHAMRIFDDPAWVDFIAFNKQYRPELMENYPFVPVIMECCGYVLTTKEMIERSYTHCITCPNCGKWCEYQEGELSI